MSLTEWAIKNNRVTLVFLLVVMFAGISAYQTLPRAEDPGFIIRIALVVTHFPGASPSRVEDLVTDPLEEAIQEIPEIDFVSSQSRPGVSLIFVNIQERYTHMRPIWDNLRRKVEDATRELPQGVIGPFVNDEFGDIFGTILTITGEGYSYKELKDVADEVRDELLRIDQVAKVDIIGAQEERIFVEYSDAQLAELGISVGQLQNILQSTNIIFPGGAIDVGAERIALEPSGNFANLDELRKTVVARPGGQELLYLEDIVTVRRGYIDPPSAMMHATGQRALALAISLREGGNIITLGDKVRSKVRYLQSVYPIGIEFDFTAFQADHVNKKIDDFVENLGQAVGIVLLVMLAFLGLRTGLVVASLIPSAMVASLLIMSAFHIGLDQMSLAALIIALGMLVDNSIVMSESILVQMREGKAALAAAIDSAAELRIPLLTSSLTTAAAFLPIYLAESSTGEYTAPLFKVVTIALLSSWVLSLTMIPLLCVMFLKVQTGEEKPGRIARGYRFLLTLGLKYRAAALGLVGLIFVLTMQLFGLLPNIFFPPNEKAIFTVEVDLPVGTPIERTEQVTQSIEQLLTQEKERFGIQNWMTFVGESAPRYFLSANVQPASPEMSEMVVNATTKEQAAPVLALIEQQTLQNFPDARVVADWLPLGPPAVAPVEIRLSGADKKKVFAIVDQVKAQLAQYPVKNIRDDWGVRGKKINVSVDQPRARRAGVSSSDVAVSLQSTLSGITATEYREGNDVIPVMLRSVASDRQDLGKLDGLNIYSQGSGRAVPLKQVADVEVEFQAPKILRRNRLPTVTVSADMASTGATPIEVSLAMKPWLEEQQTAWGPGYRFGLGGELENSGKANDSINAKGPIGMFIIILLLVAQFNSIRKPAIILLTIPLGLIGVVLGLLGTGSYFGFMTLLGIISLVGIVINNAIVLLERIQIERDAGRSPPDAVVVACQRRLRPILLTTATTVGGLIPLWLGGGPMWEPMAIAIIFGLMFATVLTLGVVPILYSLFYRVSFKSWSPT